MSEATKKQVEIEYLTFEELWNIKQTHDNKVEGAPNISYVDIEIYHQPQRLGIPTLTGVVIMDENYYLIIGVQGEIYPCKIDIFNETYDINRSDINER